MHQPTAHALPATPPPDALAELDAGAGALAALDARGARIALATNERAPVLRIALEDETGARELTPTQLFELLT